MCIPDILGSLLRMHYKDLLCQTTGLRPNKCFLDQIFILSGD